MCSDDDGSELKSFLTMLSEWSERELGGIAETVKGEPLVTFNEDETAFFCGGFPVSSGLDERLPGSDPPFSFDPPFTPPPALSKLEAC